MTLIKAKITFHKNINFFSDLSLENLKYLSSNQAIIDVAQFIRYKKQQIPSLSNATVILGGGSYAGSIVVWLKHLYPYIFKGGLASSAPLLAKMEFEGKNR